MLNQSDILGEIPAHLLTQALDDNGDGMADAAAWESVLAAAEDRLRAIFAGPVPPHHAEAAGYGRKLFVLATLYNRRGLTAEANPYTAAAARAEKRLQDIADGEADPSGGAPPTFIGHPTRIAGLDGVMA